MRTLLASLFILVVPAVAVGGALPSWEPSAETFDARLHAVSKWLDQAKLGARDFRGIEMLKYENGKAGSKPAWASRIDTGWTETRAGESYFFGVGSWTAEKGDMVRISSGGPEKPKDRVLKPAEVVRWAEWVAAAMVDKERGKVPKQFEGYLLDWVVDANGQVLVLAGFGPTTLARPHSGMRIIPLGLGGNLAADAPRKNLPLPGHWDVKPAQARARVKAITEWLEGSGVGTDRRLYEEVVMKLARKKGKKPSWLKKGEWEAEVAGERVRFGVGVTSGIKNRGLALNTAENRARHAAISTEVTQKVSGSKAVKTFRQPDPDNPMVAHIVDWYLDGKGRAYALAIGLP